MAESDAPPVVLIHGALRSRAGLWPTAVALRRRGFDVRTFGYPTRSANLDEHGARLSEFIARWQDQRGAGRWPVLGLMTHSMGGLVARAYLARSDAREQSARQRVVMLAPPNRGSVLAKKFDGWGPFRWLYGKAASELQPSRVAGLAPPPPSADVMLVAGVRGSDGYSPMIPGNNDGVVGVDETRLEDRPGLDPWLVESAHTWLQWRADVIERAAGFLAGDDTQKPAEDSAG